ncbi:hypothetical protein [Phenylobacterium sp.]|uniref:hypothetical protein n=1 Tax=Phenylobacterium sp. TaxID=1871053 RepID=UPI002811E862|nr:hypothetical protein [Phenylobacterium sp.]
MWKPRTRSPVLILAGVGALAAIAGLLIGRAEDVEALREYRGLILLASLIPALWLTWLYWRRIDEAARDAQKTAWFWGGSAGLGVGFAASMYVAVRDPTFLGLLPPNATPAELVHAGAFGVVIAQFAGFLLAWAFWWWSKR